MVEKFIYDAGSFMCEIFYNTDTLEIYIKNYIVITYANDEKKYVCLNDFNDVFCDLDNTLCANTGVIQKYYPGYYKTKLPSKRVIKGILGLFPSTTKHIISIYEGEEEGKNEKVFWVNEILNNSFEFGVPIDNQHYIANEDDTTKGKRIAKSFFPNTSIIIDDKKSTLIECKKEEIFGLYPQTIEVAYDVLLEGIYNFMLENNYTFSYISGALYKAGYNKNVISDLGIYAYKKQLELELHNNFSARIHDK